MQNIDDLFDDLLEKEALHKSLQEEYQQLLFTTNPNSIRINKVIENVKEINVHSYCFNHINLFICLETICLLEYRVSLWYTKKNTSSEYFDIQFFNLKSDALNYIESIKLKYINNPIEEIFLDQIKILDLKIIDLLNKIQYLKTKKE